MARRAEVLLSWVCQACSRLGARRYEIVLLSMASRRGRSPRRLEDCIVKTRIRMTQPDLCFWRDPRPSYEQRCRKVRAISRNLGMRMSFCEEHNAKWLIEVTYAWRTAV